jgi:glycine hydroxymethyltransferase
MGATAAAGAGGGGGGVAAGTGGGADAALEQSLAAADPEVAEAVAAEGRRQDRCLGLVASENFTSRAVREAEGSLLVNKYAEGLPGARYYGGCECVDAVEELARQRLKRLFAADHANVQPHSGAQANMAAYMALCRPGDTILSLSLAAGAHLTHGSPEHLAGQIYRFVHYGVRRDTERIDLDEVEAIARRERPALIVAGASCYAREQDFAGFAAVAARVGARLMVDMAHVAGLVAAGLHVNPVPHADVVATTTHKTLRGPRGGALLCRREHAQAVDRAVFPGLQGGPLMQVIAAKAVCFHEAAQPGFARYQAAVRANAARLAEALAEQGFRLVSGGTDTHMVLIDLRPHGVSGRQAERALEQAGILVNRVLVPFDPEPPQRTSGLRLGTPAVTSRGMGEREMESVAALVGEVVRAAAMGRERLAAVTPRVAAAVRELTRAFPAPC